MTEVAFQADRKVLPAPSSTGLAYRPYISVIVPVRNEETFLGDTLEQLLHQQYAPSRFEVLVADGASTDRTREVIAAFQMRFANLRLLDNPRRWSSAGRNAAIRAAKGEVIVLIDGHCELDNPNYLSDVADAFERSGADCLGRPQPLDVTEARPMQRAIAAARASALGHHPDSHIYSDAEGFVPPHSVAIAYRRSVFETIGLFDEAFDACEDVEFNHRVARACLRCWFTPALQVRYHPRATLSGLFRQMVRYGRGRVRLLRKHPETFSLAGFLPGAFVAGILGGPLFALWQPLLGLVYGGVLGLYLLIVLLFSIVLSRRQGEIALLPLLPLVFPAIHLGAGTGIFWEIVASGRSDSPADLPQSLDLAASRRAA
jgi:succinoglycan biosynthesis protein ExoA